MYTCPVCFFDQMPDPDKDFNICPCCGTEFGNDDVDVSHAELRADWIHSGAQWFFGVPPVGWNRWLQVMRADVGLLPYTAMLSLGENPALEDTYREINEVVPGSRREKCVNLAIAA